MSKVKTITFLFFLIINSFNLSYAYELDDNEGLVQETKLDMMVVAGAGLAGAVLGLSTLSFVEKPGDHLKNIMYGAAIGIIIGVVYVAYSQATKSQEQYGGYHHEMRDAKEFETWARYEWQEEQSHNNEISDLVPQNQLGYSFSF